MHTSHVRLNPFRTLPIAFAFLFNFMVPALNVVAPSLPGPLAVTQSAMAASDPIDVTLTLEGCRLPAGATLTAPWVCPDADYTTGNLGKNWSELDLVPHRLTTDLGLQDGATTTYTIGVTADYLNAGHPGYDVMSAPVVNEALSADNCSISSGAQTIIPGVGGTDSSIGRLLTITQDKGTTCVFDWYERLALGSHLYPGASLHTNVTNQLWSTHGIGARDVSILVKEIAPQALSKDMSATRGQTYGWEVAKKASPTSLVFEDTCDPSNDARSAEVQITITWTRSGPTGSGDTMITTHVYANNPAQRPITVTASDTIYEGSGQSPAALLHTANGDPVSVPGLATHYLVLTHSFNYTGTATDFNDVATATYTDPITDIAIPGQTSATASAVTTASQDPAANSSVVITDSESISGTGLTFSVADPGVGSFDDYTGGDTTGPVDWSSGPVSDSGSVTFIKTVSVDVPAITSGTLSDTATLTGDDQQILDSFGPLSVGITASASVSLTINKSIPEGSLRDGESVTFDFDVTGPVDFSDSASITFSYGGPTSMSTSLSGLAPGTYNVSEQPKANWANLSDQETTISLPACSGSVSFDNSELAPDLSASKTADDPSTVSAGDPIGFTIDVSNSDAEGIGTAKDVMINDPLPKGSGLDWSIDPAYAGPGTCEIIGEVGAQSLSCDLGDLAPGDSASVHVVSDTTRADCATYLNIASVTASNHDELNPQDSTTVECPELNISPTLVIEKAADTEEVHLKFDAAGKLLSASPSVVTWTLTYTLANGPVDNAVISDPIPDFLVYVDKSASNGGVYDPATQTITWTFPTLSDSGSVSFKTTTDPDAPEGKNIVNVTTIVSEQTVLDEGRDSILVTAESEEAGTSTPAPSQPDTAIGYTPAGQPITIPIELMVVLFLLGLGGLTFANVRAVRRRR